MSACSWYNGGHEWKYEQFREVGMFRQPAIGGERVKFAVEKQRRTCDECGVTEDREVASY